MALTCNIFRDDKGNITKVTAPNGEASVLYDNILSDQSYKNDKEGALRVWARAYTKTFKDSFGNWELLSEALIHSGDVKGLYADMFENKPERVLFEAAIQANSSESEKSGATATFGPDIIRVAQEMFPEAQVGDQFTPNLTGKVDKNGEPLLKYIFLEKSVQYQFKAASILISDKAIDWFKRADKHQWRGYLFWDKLISELGIPREQVELLKATDPHNPYNREDLLTSFLAIYSYTVEIETATQTKDYKMVEVGQGEFEPEPIEPEFEEEYDEIFDEQGNFAGYEVAGRTITNQAELDNAKKLSPTQHYSNVSVPGGTNYTENNINTPDITPSIKGHAAFATDKSVGWFRSDEQVEIRTAKLENSDYPAGFEDIGGKLISKGGISTKTRRILEIQSDLFQKGRDKQVLAHQFESSNFELEGNSYTTVQQGWEIEKYFKDGKPITFQEFHSALKSAVETGFSRPKENQFLQLLNRDNNWVTFFVKAIIQDSAKKGYEKVLFPAGDTANKVEGQETLEGYIKGREELISDRNSVIDKIRNNSTFKVADRFYDRPNLLIDGNQSTKEEFEKITSREISRLEYERNTYEKELQAAKEGRGKFGVINSFYETTIQNILKKRSYNPTRITDEYGNDWFEVSIRPEYIDTIQFNRSASGNYKEVLTPQNQKVFEELQGKGLITQRRWNDMYFVPKAFYQSSVSQPFTDYRRKFNQYLIQPSVVAELRVEIDRRGITWLSVEAAKSGGSYIVQITPDLQRYTQNQFFKTVGNSAFTAIADRLSKKMGIPYKIISTEEAIRITEESKIPYSGEGAFVYKGTVYVLDDALTLDNAIHEFSHFFIRAIHKQSPYLIQKLYRELFVDPEGKKIIDFVEEMYPEYSKEDQMEEVLVRAVTLKALGLVDEKTGNVIISAVKKILEAIKTLVRNIFGVSLKNLNENTTLDQLAAILVGDEKIDLADSTYFKDIFPLFNREVAQELTRIQRSSLNTSIEAFYTVVQEHLDRLIKDRDFSQLRDILANDRNSTILKDEKEVLKLAKEFTSELYDNKIAANSFSEAIEGLEIIAKRMADHVAQFSKDTDNKTKLAIFRKYSFMAREWLTVLDQFGEAVNKSELRGTKNPLTDSIRSIRDNFSFINDEIVSFYKKEGLPKAFKEEIEGNPFYQASLNEQKERVKSLQKMVKDGNPKVLPKLEKEEKLLLRYDLSEETIAKYLAGEMGDTNYYSMYLESYTSSPDPIIGTFTNWFLKQKFKAQARAQERLTKFENLVAPLYRKLGYGPSDFRKVAESLVGLEQLYFDNPEEGGDKFRKVWKFISQYGDDKDGTGWDYELNRLLAESRQARDQAYLGIKPWDEYRKKRKAFEEFQMKYMFDQEGDKVKEARLFWYRDGITFKAKEQRDFILSQIRENKFSDLTKDESLEKEQQQRELWRQFSQLSSLRDTDNKPKTGEDLEIAEAIREYQEKYGNLYEDVEIKGMFEANLKAFTDDLLDKLIASGKFPDQNSATKSPEFKTELNNWYRENHRIKVSEDFYKEREKIIAKIKTITDKLSNQQQKKELDISEKWKDILEIVKGYRDDDGQPIGSDLSDSRVAEVKKLQKTIEDIKDTYNKLNGLTEEEAEEYYNYVLQDSRGIRLAADDYKRFKELEAKSRINLSREDKQALTEAFDELRDFQSKIATPYYTQTVNKYLSDSGSMLKITPFTAEEMSDPGIIDPILDTNPSFKKWWNANHLKKEVWDHDIQSVVEKYERLYIWNRIVPNDKLFKTLLENKDYEGIANYKSPFIKVLKDKQYYFRKLKPEYENKRITGVTTDNRGNWLPKPTEKSATDDQRKYMNEKVIPFNDDGRFENKKYLEMKEKGGDSFNLLEIYKNFHLESQQDLPSYARLGLEAPRLRKNSVENTSGEILKEKPKEFAKNIMGWVQAIFKKRKDDFELGSGNYDPKTHVQTYVLTDLLGNQINSIPIKYKSWLDPDLVSMDIGKAVSMYAVSAELNRTLHEINPVANALRETLEGNKPKDEKTKARGIINIVRDGFEKAMSPHANKKGPYNRLTAINNFLERELEGIEHKMEIGRAGNQAANFFMKTGAWGSLGLNVFAAQKNLFAGRIQNNLEAVAGKTISPDSLARSNTEFFGKFMPNMISDYYKIGNKSLETQLFLLFDPLNNYRDKIGTNFSKTVKRDALDLKFIMSLQKFGEINIQGAAWLAMMLNQKVSLTDPETKETKEIDYLKAWELKEGVLTLKEGIDKKWGKEGESFSQFASRVHKVNELNQGAYSQESQPEVARYTLGRLFLFMRKFYIPGAMNRFSNKRFNSGLGDYREGYWRPFFTMFGQAIKGNVRSVSDYKNYFSIAERRQILRSLTELGLIATFASLILLLGFDGDDEDKYKKLSENSWFHNFMLYELMMIKSETETFIPMYGMGVNETTRLLGTPSIAFNTIRRWTKLGQDFANWVIGDPQGFYQQASGIYDEGQIKFFADLLNILGWRNFAYLTDNEDLKQGIKAYVAMQRRI